MRVIVVGAGIIGRSVAWRLAQRGAAVTVVDPDPSRSAARVAAGMLAPVTEAHFGEDDLLQLNLESAGRWPRFAAELGCESGTDVGYVESGTLLVARDIDDRRELDRLAVYLGSRGRAVESLDARSLRRREPALGVGTRGGLWVAGDHQVNPRATLEALASAGERRGVAEVTGAAVAVESQRVELADGRVLDADAVVACAGWSTRDLLGVPLRPIKGQVVRLGTTSRAVLPAHVVRGLDVYVVPRPDGEIVVGATSEEVGPDRTVTAGGVRALLEDAWRLLPGLDEAPLLECAAGLRPATPDGAPVLDTVDGVHVATGHHRNGVLLAPVTADAVAAAVCDGAWPEFTEPFRLDRFTEVP
jgi:glycine oxidase